MGRKRIVITPGPEEQSFAARFDARDGDLAMVATDHGVLWAQRHRAGPMGPVLELVQGIYERWPDEARWLVRQRIFTSGEPTAVEKALVKVAAKKLTGGLQLGEGTGVPPAEGDLGPVARALQARRPGRHTAPSSFRDPTEAAAWLRRTVAEITRPLPRHARARPVAAVALAPDGRVLAAAVNDHATNRTLHAELNLVCNWWTEHGGPFPSGTTVMVSLQPCRMCAAQLMTVLPADGEVVFLEHEPGAMGHHTGLQLAGRERAWEDAPGA